MLLSGAPGNRRLRHHYSVVLKARAKCEVITTGERSSPLADGGSKTTETPALHGVTAWGSPGPPQDKLKGQGHSISPSVIMNLTCKKTRPRTEPPDS